MTDGILHPIAHVEPRTGYRLLVTWASGEQSTVDFSHDITRGGVWAALRDEAKFAQATIAYHGHVLKWPEPAGSDGTPRIDIDALHAMAPHQREASPTNQLVPAGLGEGDAA